MKFYKINLLFFTILLTPYCYGDEAVGYRTTGVGSLEKCKKLGIQLCNSENVTIPTVIDSSSPSWVGIYHRTKKDGSSMCWVKLKNGGFVEETLSFVCQPIR